MAYFRAVAVTTRHYQVVDRRTGRVVLVAGTKKKIPINAADEAGALMGECICIDPKCRICELAGRHLYLEMLP